MLDKCEVAESSNCDKLHNCHACHTEYHCGWQTDEKCYTFVRESSNIFSIFLNLTLSSYSMIPQIFLMNLT